MQETLKKAGASDQSGSGKFIDTLIAQWLKRIAGGDIVASGQTEELQQVVENPIMREANVQQTPQSQEQVVHTLQRKLKQSQEAEAALSASLEVEMRNKEEIQTKLNGTWESIETITEYFNYVSENLTGFQQHRANLSALYDNVILTQQEAIQKLQSSNARSKGLEQCIAQLESRSLLQEERVQEAMTERDKLRAQLEGSVRESQLRRNELANAHAEEKLALVKEQQRLVIESENLRSQLQIAEKEKCDTVRIAVQLENELQLQKENVEKALVEQNKLQKQLRCTEDEFYSQRNNLASVHAEEKRTLVEEQQRLLTEYESLQSRLKTLQQDRNDTVETITQKDAHLSKLQDENSAYRDQIEAMTASNNETRAKCEALTERQAMWEKEVHTKIEKIQNLETMLSTIKQRETSLNNDMNKIEKKLASEMDRSKNLENKLSNVQKNLQLAQVQKDEIQKTLERIKTANELAEIEFQRQLKTLRRENEEIVMRENIKIKNTEALYENVRAKHAEEISTLRNDYETSLLESKRTIDSLDEVSNNLRKENSALSTSLTEIRADNSNLRNNYQSIMERNNDLQGKLKEVTEMLRKEVTEMKSVVDQELGSRSAKNQKQSNAKRKYEVRFDPEIMEIPDVGPYDVSTSVDFNKQYKSSSQPSSRIYSTKDGGQQEQEPEITSAGKKFFKSRPTLLRTYNKRRQDQ